MEIYVKIVMLLKYIAPAKNFSRSNSKEDEMSSNKTKMAEIAKETLKRIAGILSWPAKGPSGPAFHFR